MENYKDLQEKVWDKGLCSGCSICSIVCPMRTIYFEDDYPSTHNYCKSEKDRVPCAGCYSSCPRVDTFLEKHGMGTYLSAMAARSCIDVSKKQSGGAVTAILYNALRSNLIDSVVMVGQDHTSLKTYSVALSDPKLLLKYAGSKYIWFTPTLTALRELIENGRSSRIAVVGTPCVIQALRKMMGSDNPVLNRFKDRIALLVGVFCTEIFKYDTAISFLSENGIEPGEIKRIDIKRDIIIEKYDNEAVVLQIPKGLKRDGCNFCLDFSAVDADISAGSVGSEEGHTTLLSRTPRGSFFIESAIENGYLDAHGLDSIDAVERLSQLKFKKNLKNIEKGKCEVDKI